MRTGMVFKYERRVAFADTDMAGVAHFTALLRWVEEAEAACYRAAGGSLCRREPDGSLTGWPRVALNAEFLAPVRFDELVVITLTLAREGRSSREWGFEVRRPADSVEVAKGTMKSVKCSLAQDGRVTSLPVG